MQSENEALLEAIDMFVRINSQRKHNYWFILSLAGLLLSQIFNLWARRRLRTLQAEENQLSIQFPLLSDHLHSVDQCLQRRQLTPYLQLAPQYKRIGQLGILENVFVDIILDSSHTRGHCSVSFQLQGDRKYFFSDFVPATPRVRVSPYLSLEFDGPSAVTDFLRAQMPSQGLRHSGHTLHLFPGLNLLSPLLNADLANSVFGRGWLTQGSKTEVHKTPLQRSGSYLYSIRCTALIAEGYIRLTNITGFGNSCAGLKQEFKLRNLLRRATAENWVRAATFLSWACGAVALYSLSSWLFGKLKTIVLKEAYPGVEKSTKHFNKAKVEGRVQGSVHKCRSCKRNSIDLIFVPCYHLQTCNSCFEQSKRATLCTPCNELRYCGIMIYNSK